MYKGKTGMIRIVILLWMVVVAFIIKFTGNTAVGLIGATVIFIGIYWGLNRFADSGVKASARAKGE